MKVDNLKLISFVSFVMVLFLSFAVIGCSDKEDEITVSKESVSVRENLEQKVEISGGTGTYSCEVEDRDIVSAEIAGQVLIITGHSTGVTYVTVKDGGHTPVTITVKVLDQKVVFEITELGSLLDMGNSEYYYLIEEELLELFPFPVGTVYELIIQSEYTYSVGPGSIRGDLFIYSNVQSDPLQGTFELYGEILTFIYSDERCIYRMGADNDSWFIDEELTEEYKKKYPNADVRYIYNRQILKLN